MTMARDAQPTVAHPDAAGEVRAFHQLESLRLGAVGNGGDIAACQLHHIFAIAGARLDGIMLHRLARSEGCVDHGLALLLLRTRMHARLLRSGPFGAT